MKVLVIGLDCAAPELLLGEPRLTHMRRLMEAGCHGRLESIIPPITVPAWMCMATSRDPGSLGVYGFRNRNDYSYDGLGIVNSRSIQDLAIWDQVAREGKRAHVVGVPPNYPPRKTSGVSIGCFLTPDTAERVYTHPASLADDVARLVGDYPVDVRGFRTPYKDWLKDEIYTMTRKHFEVLRHLVKDTAWDYLQFVEIGLDRIQHGFWKYHDPEHRDYQPGNQYEQVIRDYYLYLDDEVGRLLELLDEETAVLVLSDHGAQRLDGGFCVNEWLFDQGDLALHRYPDQVTPVTGLEIDWGRTTAWSEGGYYARVFLNVKGREPQGIIDPADYEKVRDDLAVRLEATTDDAGRLMGTLVYKPQQLYREVKNVAPDLIVHFGGLYWRSVGGLGYRAFHVHENDTGPDDCNHAQFGAFILAAPGLAIHGEVKRANLLDMAPALLELAGYDVPASMQGSLAAAPASTPVPSGVSEADEEIIRQRLSGLGYIG
ncbi:MAG: alkaline phosphatase family protein [Pirellulales bacterium]